jgi:hypothetical protein
MTDQRALYAELKPSMEAVALPLFDFSKQCLRDWGNFLPHAAVLTSEGTIELVGAHGEHEDTTSTEVLPLLHGGLRALAKEKALSAIGVAENVTVTLGSQSPTMAVKVLFEHQRGLTVALYLPFEELAGGYEFGAIFTKLANPEVGVW